MNKGYLGCFGSEEYDHVIQWLLERFGNGAYYLKLIDEDNRMTGYNFVLEIDAPYDDESCQRFQELRVFKSLTRFFRRTADEYREKDQDT